MMYDVDAKINMAAAAVVVVMVMVIDIDIHVLYRNRVPTLQTSEADFPVSLLDKS